ncbi:MAG: hypothetical protein M1830_006774 [Pleopsidium flavum]|nr:MAG: hypothetical protein M1830_006774 [Pleopsidium flavum]
MAQQTCLKATEPTLETLFDSIVTVYVGPKKAKFDVHQGLICHYSSYFKAALSGSFKESKKGIVDLEDETEQTFKLFYLWLYSQKLVVEVSREYEAWLRLAELYVFGDKRGVPKLKNRIIDTMVAWNAQLDVVPLPLNFLVYDNTPEFSPLRKLLVDFVAWGMDVLDAKTFASTQEYSKEFLIDLVRAIEKRPSPRLLRNAPFRIDLCSYHEHEEPGKTK